MKRIELILLGLFLILLENDVQAQVESYFDAASVSPRQFLESVDFEVRTKKQLIIKNVSLNGSAKKYSFLFDSGSVTSYITSAVAKEIGVEVALKDSASDGFSSRYIDYGMVDYEMAGVSFSNIITGICDDFVNIDILCDVDGIIGFDLMRLCTWKIDLKAHEMLISDKSARIPEINSYYKQRMKILDNQPFVMVGFEFFSRGDMFLDLGDNTTITLNSPKEKLSFFKKKGTVLTGRGAGIATSFMKELDTSVINVRIKWPQFSFGAVRFGKAQNLENYVPDMVVDFYDCEAPNVIGGGILNFYSLVMDFPKGRMYSKIVSRESQLVSSCGIGIMPFGDKYVVSAVWDNSSAKRAKIKPGTQILQLNGLNLESCEGRICDIYALIEEEMANPNIRITIKDLQGNIRELDLTESNLYEF